MNEGHKPLLDIIRFRPAIYLDGPSLTALYHFICGYEFALLTHGFNEVDEFDIPYEFYDWVAYRLHFRGSTSGWKNMILERTDSEVEAFSRFFELLDEFHSRTPHLVAKLIGHRRTYHTQTSGGVTKLCRYPDSISLITYTDDPGFFAYSDDDKEFPLEGFFPDIERFETSTDAKRDKLTIVDEKWNYGVPINT